MSEATSIVMGTMSPEWNEGDAKSITFCVTEDCNLKCRYCYLVGKNSEKKMSFETAKKTVDYILSNRELFPESGVIWEFIGGEPFLEIDLVNAITEYFKLQMFILGHPWFNSYRISFSTNGLLYHTKKVQDYIKRNISHLSIGISLDGNKIKHDLQRIKPDGSGSYDDIMKNVPLWLEQFHVAETKATFSHDDLPHLKDSVIDLWKNGIKMVAANVVFEDVWEDGDDEIMELQLKELADYILENDMWKTHSVRFFDPSIGFPLTDDDMQSNFCGAGHMLAIDTEGNFFPCVRFYDFSLVNRKGLCIGNMEDGLNLDKIRPFMGLNLKNQSPEECLTCEVASGCAWCQGHNYDFADSDTIYQRATFACKMHKANIRANEYFWDKFEKVTGLPSERRKHKAKKNRQDMFLQFITSDRITPHCSYRNAKKTNENMSSTVFKDGLKFCEDYGMTPIMLGRTEQIDKSVIDDCMIVGAAEENPSNGNYLPIHDNNVVQQATTFTSILLVNKNNIGKLSAMSEQLFRQTHRINLILEDIEKWGEKDLENYANQLESVGTQILEAFDQGQKKEFNVLTDLWYLLSPRNCGAGTKTFSLAPNGKIYLCPAFYFDDPANSVGSLDSGIELKNSELFLQKNAPICSVCDVYGCKQCRFLNKKLTAEFNTPSKIQCLVSHVERKKSKELQARLMTEKDFKVKNVLQEIDYNDPIQKITRNGNNMVV